MRCRRARRWVFGIIALTSAASPAQAEERKPSVSPAIVAESERKLDLHRYLTEVLSRHPKLLAMEHKVEAAEATVMSARGNFDLELYASGSQYPVGKYDKTHAEIGLKQPTRLWGSELWVKYENGSGFAPYQGGRVTSEWGKGSVGILLPLLQDGSIDARRFAVLESKIQRDIAEHSLRQTRSDLLADAALAWWKWCILGHKLRIYDTLIRQAKERQAMLEQLVRAGALAPLETVDNRRTILSRRAQQASLTAEFRVAGLQVGLYRRNHEGQPRGAESAELPEVQHLSPLVRNELDRLEEDLEKTPLLNIYRGMLSAVEQELRLAKNQQLPRLDLSLAASHSAGDTRPYSAHDRSVSETTFGGKLELGLDVQRRKARGKAHALRAKRGQIEQELRLAKDMMRTEIMAAHQTLYSQLQAVHQSREATSLARQVAIAEADSLLAGQSTVMSVNIREQAALTAQLAELEALHLLQGAWIEMQRARGKTEPAQFVMSSAPLAEAAREQ